MAQFRHLFVAAILVLALCQSSFARVMSNRGKRDTYVIENPPLLAADAIMFAIEDSTEPACIDVLDNDIDTDGDLDKSTIVIFSDPFHGEAYVQEATLKLCYTPAKNFFGHDHFEYNVCDHKDNCETAKVRVSVSAINDAPICRDDFAVVSPDDYEITVDVLANDEDVDGSYIWRPSFKIVSSPKYGRAEIDRYRKIHYTPTWNDKVRFHGTDSLIYQICDNEDPMLCSYATLTIEVQDKCIACEKCWDFVGTHNLHRDRVHHFFVQDVLSGHDN